VSVARVVVTRPIVFPDLLASRLEELGCEVVSAPSISLGPPRSFEALDNLVRAPDRFDWILFMSRNAVRGFVQRRRRYSRTSRIVPTEVKVGVVGPATEAIAKRADMHVTACSSDRTGHSLADVVIEVEVHGAEVAVVQAEEGRSEILERLNSCGHRATRYAAYRTRPASVPNPVITAIQTADVDVLAFASPSSVLSFAIALGGLGEIPKGVAVAAIGPTTAKACQQAGRRPDVVPVKPGAVELADVIVAHLKERPNAFI